MENTIKSPPKVSIGMPVYNGEPYIREALDSLLAQTFTDFELIISDNASIDSTESICRQYAQQDARIKYIRQEYNIGALANFQFLLDCSSSTYFMWAACDDKWSTNWIESLKSTLDATGAGSAFGKLVHIDADGATLHHPANEKVFNYDGSTLRRRTKYYLEFERYGKANPIYSLFRRAILRDFSITSFSVDFHIVFTILLRTPIIPVPAAVIYKRVHTSCAGGMAGNGLGKFIRVLSYLVMPVDINFIQGYFRYGRKIEWLMFAILLPVKFFLGYMFYFNSIFHRISRSLQVPEGRNQKS